MTEPTKYLRTTNLSLSGPKGLCVDTDLDRLLICDTGNDQIVLTEVQGNKSVDTTDEYNSTSMDAPEAACYHDGYFYVCDTGNHVVVRLRSHDMTYKDHFGSIGSSGSTTAKLDSPNGICHNKEYLFVEKNFPVWWCKFFIKNFR